MLKALPLTALRAGILKAKMVLDEYTGERLTAHIEVIWLRQVQWFAGKEQCITCRRTTAFYRFILSAQDE